MKCTYPIFWVYLKVFFFKTVFGAFRADSPIWEVGYPNPLHASLVPGIFPAQFMQTPGHDSMIQGLSQSRVYTQIWWWVIIFHITLCIQQIFRPNHIPYEVGHIHKISHSIPQFVGEIAVWTAMICIPHWQVTNGWCIFVGTAARQLFRRRSSHGALRRSFVQVRIDSRNHGACWV